MAKKSEITLESVAAQLAELTAQHNALVTSHNELVEELKELKSQPKNSVRDRGPLSTKEMTEDDARKCMIGEFKDLSHRKAAETLGLSYGQVYSARNGFTFKGVYAEMKKLED